MDLTVRTRANPARGGVGLYINSKLKYHRITPEAPFIEGICEATSIYIKDIDTVIIAAYRPNGFAHSCPYRFVDHISDYIDSIMSLREYSSATYVVSGDFNVDLKNTH